MNFKSLCSLSPAVDALLSQFNSSYFVTRGLLHVFSSAVSRPPRTAVFNCGYSCVLGAPTLNSVLFILVTVDLHTHTVKEYDGHWSIHSVGSGKVSTQAFLSPVCLVPTSFLRSPLPSLAPTNCTFLPFMLPFSVYYCFWPKGGLRYRQGGAGGPTRTGITSVIYCSDANVAKHSNRTDQLNGAGKFLRS